MAKKMTRNALQRLIAEAVRGSKAMIEAEERDSYTGGQGSYTIENPQGLEALLFDEKYTIAPGTFANIVYIQEARLNKGYNKDGYTDSKGQFTDFDNIEKQGRALGKRYINDVYDSDKYKERNFKQRTGLQRDFAVMQVTAVTLNWGAMTYHKNKERQEDAIRNAEQGLVDKYTRMDPDFDKRFAAYCQANPELQDELEAMRDQGTLDRQTIIDIRKTPLRNNTSQWVKQNDYVSKNAKTGTMGLRMTQTSTQTKSQTSRYYIVRNEAVNQISADEYFHIRKMFASSHKPVEGIHTELGDLLDGIKGECDFRDRDISNIVRLSFALREISTGQVKKFTYVNNEISVPGLSSTMRMDDLLKAPMAESRKRKKGKRMNEAYRGTQTPQDVLDAIENIRKHNMWQSALLDDDKENGPLYINYDAQSNRLYASSDESGRHEQFGIEYNFDFSFDENLQALSDEIPEGYHSQEFDSFTEAVVRDVMKRLKGRQK